MSNEPAVPAGRALRDGCVSGEYDRRYAASIADPDAYWARAAQRLDWIEAPTVVRDVAPDADDGRVRWYPDGVLNACANCLDRHLATRGDNVAIIAVGAEPSRLRRITYRQLHREVCRFANALLHLGLARGDRVAIHLPTSPEAAIAMLACARVGAIHVLVSVDAAPEMLAACLADAQCRLIVTADEAVRGDRTTPLKDHVDVALTYPRTTSVETVILVRRTGSSINLQAPRDRWYADLVDGQSADCPPAPMHAGDPLCIVYTRGTHGRVDGFVHVTGGWLARVACTGATVFGLRGGDVAWCTADVSSISGHGCVVYGPLAAGATTVLFEGATGDPGNAARMWQVVAAHGVTSLCVDREAIHGLLRTDDAVAAPAAHPALRLFGVVDGPLDAPARAWYERISGAARCPVVDTWGSAATGGIVLASVPGRAAAEGTGALWPCLGIQPAIVDAEGKVLAGACTGNLAICDAWPGQPRTLRADRARSTDAFFTRHPDGWVSGTPAHRDADGGYRIAGDAA